MEIINERLKDSLSRDYNFREIMISKAHSTYTLQSEGLNLAGYIESISGIRIAILDHILLDESKISRGIALKSLQTLENKLKEMGAEYFFAYFNESQTVRFLSTCGFLQIYPKDLEKENTNLSKYLYENLGLKTLLYKKLR